MSEPIRSINIAPDAKSKAYYQGMAAGQKAVEGLLKPKQKPGFEQALRFFWLSVGARMNADGIDGDDSEVVSMYVAGANIHQPTNGDWPV